MWRAARPSWLKDMLLFNIECGTKIFGGTSNNVASLQMEKSSNNNCLSEPGACKQLEAGFFGVIAAELQEDLWTLGVGNLKWQTPEESLGYIQIVARLHANQRESMSFWWVQTLPLCAKHRCWIWKNTSASGNRFYFCLNVVQTNKLLLRFVFYAKGYARCSRWATFEWKIFKGGGKTLVKNLRNSFLHGCFFGSDRSSINSKRQCRRIAGPLKTRCNPWRWKSCNLCALCDVVGLNTQCGCNNCKCDDGGWLDHPTSVPFWLTEKWVRSWKLACRPNWFRCGSHRCLLPTISLTSWCCSLFSGSDLSAWPLPSQSSNQARSATAIWTFQQPPWTPVTKPGPLWPTLTWWHNGQA